MPSNPNPTATFQNDGPYTQGQTGAVFFTNPKGSGGIFFYSFDFNNDGVFEVYGGLESSYAIPPAYMINGKKVRGRIKDKFDKFTDYVTTLVINAAPIPPSTPTNFVGTAGNATVGLSWDAVSGATSYKIYRSNVSGNTSFYTTITGTAYNDTNVTNTTQYFYQVTAVGLGGESSKSNQVAVTPIAPPPPIPPVPTNLVATPGDSVINLSWSPSVGAERYFINKNGQFYRTALTTSYSDTNVINGVTYTYAVAASNSAGDSQSTPPVSASPNGPPPPPPNTDFIGTEHDKIPNFGANPTILSTKDGNWSDPTVWSLGRVPTLNDVAAVVHNIKYDVLKDDILNTVTIHTGGVLDFKTDINTRLVVINLLVLTDGALVVGTESAPISSSVKAEIIIADVPINTNYDPETYGNGLIAMGKVTMHGKVLDKTFLRLASEPLVGNTEIHLTEPVSNWAVGNKLIIPRTDQANGERPLTNAREIVSLSAVSSDGLTLTLSQPLAYDHKGCYDGNDILCFLPHVGNLTRNISIRSANASGTRGHCIFLERADVDIRYASFGGLGRTRVETINNTVLDENRNIIHLGTNQQGRYTIHIHRCKGPVVTPANGYQFTLIGNTIMCPLDPMPFRWGISAHDSDYGLIKDNVLYNWAGAGIVFESGHENFNIVDHNFVVSTSSGGGRADSRQDPFDAGFDGAAIWSRGPNNYIRNNVCAEFAYGWETYQVYLSTIRVPLFKGADKSIEGQYEEKFSNGMPHLEFINNEFYAGYVGISYWWLGSWNATPYGTEVSLFKDCRVWHVQENTVYGYPCNKVTFDNLTYIGYKPDLVNQWWGTKSIWYGDYYAKDFVIKNSKIHNARIGVYVSTFTDGDWTVDNCDLMNACNMIVQTPGAPGASPSGMSMPPSHVYVKNTKFSNLFNIGQDQSPWNIVMRIDGNQGSANFIVRQIVDVVNYNQVQGDDFRLYYREQAADSIVPQSDPIPSNPDIRSLIGSPVAGLTNQQNFDTYSICIAGEIAPATCVDRDKIAGLCSR